jgi:hypothetical protein
VGRTGIRDSRQVGDKLLPSIPKNAKTLAFFLAQFCAKIGQNWNPGRPPVRRLHAASLRFPYEKPSSWLFFLSIFLDKKMAKAGAFSNQFIEGMKQLYELEPLIKLKPYLTNQWEKRGLAAKRAS